MSKAVTTNTTTTSGRARVLPLAVSLAILAVGSLIATQLVASALQYQPALGEPIAQIFGRPLYQPLGWLKWFFAYRTIEHPVLDAAFAIAARAMAGTFVAAAAVAIFMRYLMTRDLQKVTPDLHGTAHWLTAKEVMKSGLVGTGAGVYIGAYTHPKTGTVHYLRHDGPEHVMALAPTRSGKGVGLVLPTLLSWPHSVVVHDMKGEAWAITAGFRKSIGNHVLRFDPADPSGKAARYNPLEEVRIGTEQEVGDVQNLVTMIVDPDGKGLNDHWAKTGHALLVGAVLHVLYSEPRKTLEGVSEFLSDPSREFHDTLSKMLDTEHDHDGSKGWTNSSGEPTLTHPVVASSARDMLNKADNERSGVLSTAMSFLTLYRDPIVASNTRVSDFRIGDLMNAESPVSLYLVVRPSDKDRLKPLIRLMMNQIVRGLTEHMEFKGGRSVATYKHRLLLLIDEFPALGKLEIFEEALAFVAGYGIKAYLIIQDQAQLEKHYGKEQSITSNCHIRIAYAPNKIETAEMLSKMVGTTTVVKNTYSFSGQRNKTTLNNISSQVSEVSRPLLTADEIMRLAGPKKDGTGNITAAGDMLIFQAGEAPIKGTQILYFLDPTFSERSQIEAPDSSDRVRNAALPSPAQIHTAAPGEHAPPAESELPSIEPEGEEHEDSDSSDDYETPPLTDAALIADDEEYPEAFDVPIDPEEEDPPLGRELSLTADELAAIPDDPDADDAASADADPSQADDFAAPEEDPFLAMSRQWSSDVPATIELPDADPPPTPDSSDESSPPDAFAPPPDGRDPFLAASRSWAGPLPPDTSDLGFNFRHTDAHETTEAATDAPAGDAFVDPHDDASEDEDADPMAGFDVLNAMASEAVNPRT